MPREVAYLKPETIVKEPTLADVQSIAEHYGLSLSQADAEGQLSWMSALLRGFSAIDNLPDSFPEIRYPRRSSSKVSPDQNPLGAWWVKTEIDRASSGKLRGRTIAIKDNVFVAGVPLMNGASILEGYVPPFDATIVTRILDAGGQIVGKSVCEAYCSSGGSHTSQSGPVHNPHRRGYSAGGSSSGSGALVAAGEVDMAIGCDQGGSIRIPSSWCGIYGMKPTTGLVPYTGILGFDPVLDHAGPMTTNVEDNALFLEVLAGADGLDPRQVNPRVGDYTRALGQNVKGLRIGVLGEGFGREESEPAVDAIVRSAGQRFAALGAAVSNISVPLHSLGGAIMFGTVQSIVNSVLTTDGFGMGRDDVMVPSFMEVQSRWRQRPNDLPVTLKNSLLLCEFLRRERGYQVYARTVNLIRQLRAAYDHALKSVDLLLMPTTPMKAQPLPPADASAAVQIGAAYMNLGNTSPFDVSQHPAMSMPCGMIDELPAGMMLVARHWEEATIYRAAHALQQSGDWRAW
jgi:amidase